MINVIRRKVSGIKIDFSEMAEHSTATHFTGWIHIAPSAAGKEKAAQYMLQKINQNMGTKDQKLHAHVIGDASNDMRILTAGSHPLTDPYILHQYGVHNFHHHTQSKLTKVVQAHSQSISSEKRRAHLTLLNAKGPDGVYEVIISLQ